MKVLDCERDFILDPNCVLYLPLWKKDGDAIESDDRYGHLGTVTGAKWILQGRYFDGTDDYISLPSGGAYNLTGNLTVISWINCASHVGWRKVFGTGTYQVAGYLLQIDPNGAFMLITSQVAAEQTTLSQNGEVPTTTWTFLASVLNGATAYLYKNGVEISSYQAQVAHIAPASSAVDATIGIDADKASNPFAGEIGDLMVYSRVLSAGEIANYYESTKWRYK